MSNSRHTFLPSQKEDLHITTLFIFVCVCVNMSHTQRWKFWPFSRNLIWTLCHWRGATARLTYVP